MYRFRQLKKRRGKGEEDRRTGGQEDRRTGGQEDRRAGGQEGRRGGEERSCGDTQTLFSSRRQKCYVFGARYNSNKIRTHIVMYIRLKIKSVAMYFIEKYEYKEDEYLYTFVSGTPINR